MRERDFEITEIVKAIRPNECLHFSNEELDCAKCPLVGISASCRCFYYFIAEKVYDYLVKKVAEEKGDKNEEEQKV